MEWTPKTCQWIGPDKDPVRDTDLFTCLSAVMPGKSYCAEHYSKVYMGGTALRRKRQNKKELEAELAKIMCKDEDHEHSV